MKFSKERASRELEKRFIYFNMLCERSGELRRAVDGAFSAARQDLPFALQKARA
jgi:hypothetical protein